MALQTCSHKPSAVPTQASQAPIGTHISAHTDYALRSNVIPHRLAYAENTYPQSARGKGGKHQVTAYYQSSRIIEYVPPELGSAVLSQHKQWPNRLHPRGRTVTPAVTQPKLIIPRTPSCFPYNTRRRPSRSITPYAEAYLLQP